MIISFEGGGCNGFFSYPPKDLKLMRSISSPGLASFFFIKNEANSFIIDLLQPGFRSWFSFLESGRPCKPKISSLYFALRCTILPEDDAFNNIFLKVVPDSFKTSIRKIQDLLSMSDKDIFFQTIGIALEMGADSLVSAVYRFTWCIIFGVKVPLGTRA